MNGGFIKKINQHLLLNKIIKMNPNYSHELFIQEVPPYDKISNFLMDDIIDKRDTPMDIVTPKKKK